MHLRSSAGFAGAILGGGTVGRGAKSPSETKEATR
jgi:hypothetical protein